MKKLFVLFVVAVVAINSKRIADSKQSEIEVTRTPVEFSTWSDMVMAGPGVEVDLIHGINEEESDELMKIEFLDYEGWIAIYPYGDSQAIVLTYFNRWENSPELNANMVECRDSLLDELNLDIKQLRTTKTQYYNCDDEHSLVIDYVNY